MKKALVFGAGNIGRGFIGQLLGQSGYEVVFSDINEAIVERLNQDHCYPIHFLSNCSCKDIIIHNVRAVNAYERELVAEEFIDADIIAVSVGVNALEDIASSIADGLRMRWRHTNMQPLNLLVCENMLEADIHLRKLVSSYMSPGEHALMDEIVGFVMASIGRMVPPYLPGESPHNLLEIRAEEYNELPVDRDGFKGEIPDIRNMFPFAPFDFYIKRKIYMHNMGHTLTAYLGYLKKHEYIYSAIEDPIIKGVVDSAFDDVSKAMACEYGMSLNHLDAYKHDLMARFANRILKDPIERVARDPVRKLSANDRFVGAARLCEKHGILSSGILLGIAAGYLYSRESDSSSIEIQQYIREYGIEAAITHFSGLGRQERMFDRIVDYYSKLKNENSLEGVF